MPRTHNSFSGLLAFLAITAAIGSSSHASAEAIFDFESPQTPVGLATPFSYTEGGITAIFSTLRSNPYVVFLSTSVYSDGT